MYLRLTKRIPQLRVRGVSNPSHATLPHNGASRAAPLRQHPTPSESRRCVMSGIVSHIRLAGSSAASLRVRQH